MLALSPSATTLIQVVLYLVLPDCPISATCMIGGASVFAVQPADLVVQEGDDGSFTCIIAGGVHIIGRITWQINPSLYRWEISQEVNDLTNEVSSTLTIHGPGKQPQVQRCEFYLQNSDMSIQVCQSRWARLSVQYFPQKNEVTCGSGATTFREGDTMRFWCKSSMGNPEVQLQWHPDNLNETSEEHEYMEEHHVLHLDVEMSHVLHNRTLVCSVSSPDVFPQRQHLCTLGPFIVYYKPKMHIQALDDHIDLNRTRTVKFQCLGHANPRVDNYLWTCTPASAVLGCSSETNTLKLSISENEQISVSTGTQTAISVTCFASNSQGISSVSSQIVITKSEGSGQSEPLRTNFISLNLHLVYVKISKSLENALDLQWMCTVLGNDTLQESVRIQWSFDDIIINRTYKEFHSQQISPTEFLLSCNSVVWTDGNSSVACEVHTDQDEVRVRTEFSLPASLLTSITDGLTPTSGDYGFGSAFPTRSNTLTVTELWKELQSSAMKSTGTSRSVPDTNHTVVMATDLSLVQIHVVYSNTLSIGIASGVLLCSITIVLVYKHFKNVPNDIPRTDESPALVVPPCSALHVPPRAELTEMTPSFLEDPIYEEPTLSLPSPMQLPPPDDDCFHSYETTILNVPDSNSVPSLYNRSSMQSDDNYFPDASDYSTNSQRHSDESKNSGFYVSDTF